MEPLASMGNTAAKPAQPPPPPPATATPPAPSTAPATTTAAARSQPPPPQSPSTSMASGYPDGTPQVASPSPQPQQQQLSVQPVSAASSATTAAAVTTPLQPSACGANSVAAAVAIDTTVKLEQPAPQPSVPPASSVSSTTTTSAAAHPLSPSTASSAPAGRKRRARRKAVTEEEDVAILRAVATLRPQYGAWGTIKKGWQKVVEAVVADVGEHSQVSVLLCQRRYEMLVERFIVRRELEQDSPQNPELRKLLEQAVEEKKVREETLDATTAQRMAKAMTKQPVQTMDLLRTALAAATNDEDHKEVKRDGRYDVEMKSEASDEEEEDGDIVQERPSSMVAQMEALLARATSHTSDCRASTSVATRPADKKCRENQVSVHVDDLFASAPSSRSPTKRRTFMESTLVSVLERIAGLESAWLENAREERELKKRQLDVERATGKTAGTENHVAVEKSKSGTSRQEADQQRVPEVLQSIDKAALTMAETTTNCDSLSEAVEEEGAISAGAVPTRADKTNGSSVEPTQATVRPNQEPVSSEDANQELITAEGEVSAKLKPATEERISPQSPTPVTLANSEVVTSPPSLVVESIHVVTPKPLAAGSDTIPSPSPTTPCLVNVASSTPSSDALSDVSKQDFEALQHQVAVLTRSLDASREDQSQLKREVGTLFASLRECNDENKKLSTQVVALQTLLRDAASLARTLRALREAHQHHEKNFLTYVQALNAQVDALKRGVLERHQVVRSQLATQEGSVLKLRHEMRESIEAEQSKSRVNYETQLVELKQKMARLDGPIAQLQTAIQAQQFLMKQLEQAQEMLSELRAAIDAERNERHGEYGELLHTLEQVIAGKAELI